MAISEWDVRQWTRSCMIRLMAEAVALAAQVKSRRAVWVYVNELPPRQMVDFGHLLPDP